MLEELKQEVYEANMALYNSNLIVLTWGNVSQINRELGIIAIKPSGVSYLDLKPSDIVLVDLDGNVLEGKYKPSSDTKTHIELYKAFSNIGGVVHTHSTYATAFAQAGMDIIPYGTTHADLFYGNVVCTRDLTIDEINNDYEKSTGAVIVESYNNLDYEAIPAVLVKNHGPFIWGKSAKKAVENAICLEEVAKMAYISRMLNPNIEKIDDGLLDKHYYRKHGKNKYYGQGE